MIISKTPFRIPLSGGGTDLEFYYKKDIISYTFMRVKKMENLATDKDHFSYLSVCYCEYGNKEKTQEKPKHI